MSPPAPELDPSDSVSRLTAQEEQDLLPQELVGWLQRANLHAKLQITNEQGDALTAAESKSLREYLVTSERQRRNIQQFCSLGEASAHLAHEARNVLSAILGLTQLGSGLKSEDRRALIISEAHRGTELLSSFLGVLSRRGSPETETAVRDILEPVTMMLSGEVRARKCALTINTSTDIPLFRGNVAKLRQALLNLVLNAIQITPPGGHVELCASAHPFGLSLQILDTGPGIPQELLDHIFEPLMTTRQESGGTGLGLSISRQLIEGMGGSLTAKNRETGGACFEILLPFVAPESVRGEPISAAVGSTRRG